MCSAQLRIGGYGQLFSKFWPGFSPKSQWSFLEDRLCALASPAAPRLVWKTTVLN
jgi:hypothetical protein